MGSDTGSVLFVGAVESEIKLISEKLSLLSSGHSSVTPRSLETMVAGVGNLAAALSLQKRILSKEELPIKEIIFLGAAGFYSKPPGSSTPFKELGGSNEFGKVELAVYENRARIPAPMVSLLSCKSGALGATLFQKLKPHRGATNSPDSITLEECGNIKYAGAEFIFENMEVYGLALVANSYQIPFGAFYALTNLVCKDGSTQWQSHHLEATAALQQKIIAALQTP